MELFYETIEKMCTQVKEKLSLKEFCKNEEITAIILGSGLGGFANNIEDVKSIKYSEIEGFPITTNTGHKGRMLFGYINNKTVIVMEGRIHYYEGYSMKEVVTPIYFMKLMGTKKIILTNAAGGIGDNFEVGNLMMITDHITSFVPSPLIGKNDERFGLRFPDMSCVYNKKLQQVIRSVADRENIELKEGVYLQTTGPNYETPAEIQMYKKLGADAVGMSTAVEAMVANYLQIKVCGISCITNKAAGLSDKELNDEEVKEVASKVAKDFETLLKGII